MQTQTSPKKRIPYSRIFVSIGCILIVIRVILYFAPSKPEPFLAGKQIYESSVADKTESSAPEKKNTYTNPAISETFHLTAGTTEISLPATGGSLLSIVTDAQKRGEIDFSGKEYSGLGFFVTKIGSLKQKEDKYLIYSVNGQEASVGISIYIPKNGDTIIWELK